MISVYNNINKFYSVTVLPVHEYSLGLFSLFPLTALPYSPAYHSPCQMTSLFVVWA